jgi:hypothetical protein
MQCQKRRFLGSLLIGSEKIGRRLRLEGQLGIVGFVGMNGREGGVNIKTALPPPPSSSFILPSS